MSNSPESILTRLEELRKWQDEQQKKLFQRQSDQRKNLNIEQRKLYESLGLSQDIEISTPLKNLNLDNSCNNNNDESSFIEDDEKHIEKKPFLRRGEGLTSRFKVHPDTFKLKNLPKYKYAIKSLKLKPRPIKVCKKNLENIHPVGEFKLNNNKSYENIATELDEISFKNQIPSEIKSVSKPLNWSRLLDNSNISTKSNDISTKEKILQLQKEIEELNMFELLENKVDNSSFCSTESSFLRFSGQRSDDPSVYQNNVQNNLLKFEKPIISDISENSSEADNAEEEEGDEEDEEEIKDSIHVRFSENVLVNEVDDSSETGSIFTKNDVNHSSTPNEKSNFPAPQKLNRLITNNNFIEEKSEILKQRLEDLEAEIETFRQHNSVLTKLKQDHELDRIQLENQFQEMEDRLNDERIQMEVYLNDERIKIQEDKERYEKLIKQSKTPNRSERNEITKLKEELTEHQKQIKERDSKHVSATARLRAQIRNFEKEINDKDSQIDDLKKENKKIELENTKLKRENSNKVLQQINKNIEKLSPLINSSTETTTKAKRSKVFNETARTPVVAKVISHRNDYNSTLKRRTKSVTDLPDLSFERSDESSDDSSTDDEESPSLLTQINSTLKKKEADVNLNREIENSDGSKDIWYPNGNIKKISADGMILKMLYFNKDIKETNITDGIVKYYYAETNTWQTTYLNGLEILEFPRFVCTISLFYSSSFNFFFLIPVVKLNIVTRTEKLKFIFPMEQLNSQIHQIMKMMKNGDIQTEQQLFLRKLVKKYCHYRMVKKKYTQMIIKEENILTELLKLYIQMVVKKLDIPMDVSDLKIKMVI